MSDYPAIHPKVYRLYRNIFRVTAHLITAQLDIKGAEKVPAEGPLIIAINHLSYFDTPIFGVACPRQMHPFAADKYEDHIFSPVLNAAGTIYVNREEADRTALKQALAVLEDGGGLVVAPEGTRSRSAALSEGKSGVAYLATRNGTCIVPAALWGTEQILPALKRFRRADVHVRFGEPFTLPEGRARTPQLEQYTDDIMQRIAEMLPASYRGVYK